MPGSGHGMPLFVSILAPFILRKKDVSDFEQKKAVSRVNNFPAIAILSSKEDNAYSWVKSGELLEKLLLSIHAEKMAASIMIAPIEVAHTREELQAIVNLHDQKMQGLIPQTFLGFGFPAKTSPHSPRKKLSEVII